MTLPNRYTSILESKGKLLSLINPGSSEVALTSADALEAIEALRGSRVAILGGDVLTEENGSLRYVYANWHSDRKSNEGADDYVTRSHSETTAYILGYKSRSGITPLFVLVTDSQA